MGWTVLNWNNWKQQQSLSFFDALGLSQIISVNVDEPGDPVTMMAQNLSALDCTALGRGTMYTTWINDYGDLSSSGQEMYSHYRP